EALQEVVERLRNSLVARNIEVGLDHCQAVDQLLLISHTAGLLPDSLFGELVARGDQLSGAHSPGDPTLGVKRKGVEFESLFGVAGSRGVGDVVLGGFEYSTVGFQGACGGDESCE